MLQPHNIDQAINQWIRHSILFEIADLNIKGLPVFIFREFCKDKEIQGYSFINCMDDFGLDNIRATKLSFRPFKVLPTYAVSRKNGAP